MKIKQELFRYCRKRLCKFRIEPVQDRHRRTSLRLNTTDAWSLLHHRFVRKECLAV
jgi:hypothetical protein